MDQQELVDRLVVAVEEQDVLYVVLHLQEMAHRGLVNPASKLSRGLNLEHSWKPNSALVAAVHRPHTPLREFILHLLLVHVREPSHHQASSVALSAEQGWSQAILLHWKDSVQHEEEGSALHLLSLEPVDVAEWIDANLPPHPDPDSLTGNGPLPSPPPPERLVGSEPPSRVFIGIRAEGSSPPAPATASTPVSSPARNSRRTRPCPPGNPQAQIRLLRLRDSVNANSVRYKLPSSGGMAALDWVGPHEIVMTFASPGFAQVALPRLQRWDKIGEAILEADYRALRTTQPASPVTPPAGTASAPPYPPSMIGTAPVRPSREYSTSPCPPPAAPPSGWQSATPYARAILHPFARSISLRLWGIPLDTSQAQLKIHLDAHRITYKDLLLNVYGTSKAAIFVVPTRGDWLKARAALHGRFYGSSLLSLERVVSPQGSDAPAVVVEGLSSICGSGQWHTLISQMGRGTWPEWLGPIGGGHARGIARASSPASARELVDDLDGRVFQGSSLHAYWAYSVDGEKHGPSRGQGSTTGTTATVPDRYAPNAMTPDPPTPRPSTFPSRFGSALAPDTASPRLSAPSTPPDSAPSSDPWNSELRARGGKRGSPGSGGASEGMGASEEKTAKRPRWE